MNCDFIAKYQTKIIYNKSESTGIIIKFNEFSKHFFVLTAKHTFGESKINIENVDIFYETKPLKIVSFFTLDVDIVVFIFEKFEGKILDLELVHISNIEADFKECAFSGYPNNVGSDFCEKAKYHQKVSGYTKWYIRRVAWED